MNANGRRISWKIASKKTEPLVSVIVKYPTSLFDEVYIFKHKQVG